MCGICGKLVWDQTNPVSESLITKMNQSLTHRGPDDEGVFLDSFKNPNASLSGSLGMAMRRLSIIDLQSGKQPVTNETDDIVVVYNGETFNFPELTRELKDKDHTFKTQTDTEVLVHGYEQWGLDMPLKLNGMFGFALWDKKKNRLLLARDRMGIKPLYYSVGPKSLVFGSEIKAILEDPEVSREVDMEAVDDYFSLRYVPTPHSIYKSIKKLEPGTFLLWEKGKISQKNYWSPSAYPKEDLGLKTYIEKCDAVLSEAVKRQLVSDVPLGTFLSGGLDSPTISYYAKKFKPDLMTFNIYFSDKSFSEREAAKEVAKHLGTNHIEKMVNPSVIDIIPSLVDIFDEPFGDESMIPTFFLTKLAREHMTVALSGDGGDEIFGGYPTYLADRYASVYKKIPGFLKKGILEPVVNNLPVSFDRISFDYKAKAFIKTADRPSPLEHFGWTEIFDQKQKSQLYNQETWNQLRARPLGQSFVDAYQNGGSKNRLENFLRVDQKTHLLDEFLVKVDRLSMAHSLEVRPPFLDAAMVDFASELPIQYKLKGFTTKYLIRKLMNDRLPSSIIRGSKKGFSPPTAKWLASDLKKYAEEKLSVKNISKIPFLNPDFPSKLLERHLNREENHARRLWPLLVFVEWYERKILLEN